MSAMYSFRQYKNFQHHFLEMLVVDINRIYKIARN